MKAVLRGRAGEISYKILYKKLRNGSGYDMSRMPVFRKMCNFVPDAKFTREA